MGHHVLLYEEVLRIPLVVWAPGRLAPRVDAGSASLVDLAPTILGLVGLSDEMPAALDGRDLLRPPAPEADRAVFAEWWGLLLSRPRQRLEASLFRPELTAEQIFAFIEHGADRDSAKAVIRGRWKLVWRSDGPIELYDLEDDPHETRNAAAERPELVRELAAALAGGLRAEATPAGPREDGGREFEQALRSLGYVN
jgi:arylsulfatase A-like enzyme